MKTWRCWLTRRRIPHWMRGVCSRSESAAIAAHVAACPPGGLGAGGTDRRRSDGCDNRRVAGTPGGQALIRSTRRGVLLLSVALFLRAGSSAQGSSEQHREKEKQIYRELNLTPEQS